jgi:hypothetical protein
MVDELGDLERELHPLRPKIARAEALRKALREAVKDEDATKAITLEGARWNAVLGCCGNSTEIIVRALYKRLGIRRFLDLAKVSLKDAAGTCGPDVLGTCTRTEQTGSRALTLVQRAAQ